MDIKILLLKESFEIFNFEFAKWSVHLDKNFVYSTNVLGKKINSGIFVYTDSNWLYLEISLLRGLHIHNGFCERYVTISIAVIIDFLFGSKKLSKVSHKTLHHLWIKTCYKTFTIGNNRRINFLQIPKPRVDIFQSYCKIWFKRLLFCKVGYIV